MFGFEISVFILTFQGMEMYEQLRLHGTGEVTFGRKR